MDPSPAINLALATGKDALKTLNKWLDGKETAINWYGDYRKDFIKPHKWWHFSGFIRRIWHGFTPEIEYVFTIRKEDWQMVIIQVPQVAHTWYRAKKDTKGECSWLPLYRLCKNSLPLAERGSVLAKADSAGWTLGIVHSLPAARLDLWGLVVMAYANGAWAQETHAPDGGFRAKLLGKNFVLSISQPSSNAEITGHLEPREHPDNKEPLPVDDAISLLEHGQSFSIREARLGWPVNGELHQDPPMELVNGLWDKQLEEVVLDFFKARELREKLRHAISQYRNEWVGFVCEPNEQKDRTEIRDISSDLAELEDHQRRAHKLRPSAEQDHNHKHSFEALCGFPEERQRNMRRLWDLIDIQLWQLKLSLCDKVTLIGNVDQNDAIETFERGGKLLDMSYLYCDKDPGIEHRREGMRGARTMCELSRKHRVVMAIARMLWLSKEVDPILSTRDTGNTILLG